MTGKTKFFNDVKGFGFLIPDDGSKDCFIHHTDIVMSGFKKLAEGQLCEFDIVETERGRKAQNCRPA